MPHPGGSGGLCHARTGCGERRLAEWVVSTGVLGKFWGHMQGGSRIACRRRALALRAFTGELAGRRASRSCTTTHTWAEQMPCAAYSAIDARPLAAATPALQRDKLPAADWPATPEAAEQAAIGSRMWLPRSTACRSRRLLRAAYNRQTSGLSGGTSRLNNRSGHCPPRSRPPLPA